MYSHVVRAKAGRTRATALCGMHAVLLGFDYAQEPAHRKDFLGFAIHRVGISDPGETRWLVGQRRFAFQPKDRTIEIATDKAPIQKFRWGDYGTQPGHRYRYEVHAVTGDPHAPTLSTPAALEVFTATNAGHDLEMYFNRGVTSALAYRSKFENEKPENVEDGRAFLWLSRGLLEALVEFVGDARKGETLKISIYEFFHPSMVDALRAAKKQGAKIRIIYHAKAGTKDAHRVETNSENTKAAGIPAGSTTPRTNVPKISHNKYFREGNRRNRERAVYCP